MKGIDISDDKIAISPEIMIYSFNSKVHLDIFLNGNYNYGYIRNCRDLSSKTIQLI